MKKRTVIIIALVIIIPIAVLFGVLQYSFRTFTLVPHGKIADNFYTVKAEIANLYVLKKGTSVICFDVGDKEDLVKDGFDAIGIEPSAVTHVFLTHSDYDHAGALALFENAKVYLSEDEKAIFPGGGQHRFLWFSNRLDREFNTLEDNQIVDIDGTVIHCISTPGHTPGSMSFLVNGRLLITGDALSLVDGKAEPFPKVFTMDSETMKSSIKKLGKLKGVDMICTAHHGISRDFDTAMEEWR